MSRCIGCGHDVAVYLQIVAGYRLCPSCYERGARLRGGRPVKFRHPDGREERAATRLRHIKQHPVIMEGE